MEHVPTQKAPSPVNVPLGTKVIAVNTVTSVRVHRVVAPTTRRVWRPFPTLKAMCVWMPRPLELWLSWESPLDLATLTTKSTTYKRYSKFVEPIDPSLVVIAAVKLIIELLLSKIYLLHYMIVVMQ